MHGRQREHRYRLDDTGARIPLAGHLTGVVKEMISSVIATNGYEVNVTHSY